MLKKIMREYGISSLYDFQKEAIEYIDKGSNVIVSAPTGSGKSFIGLYALLRSFLKLHKKGVYIAPQRSLAYEKELEFAKLKKFRADIITVTGETWVYGQEIEQADILISTVDKFDSIVRHNPEYWVNVGVLVVDEIHMIDEGRRGAMLEQILVEAMENGVQIVGLSATIGNLSEFAHWLNAELVYSDKRRVKLRYGVFYNGSLEWGDGEVVNNMSKDWIRSLVVPIIKETDKSVLIFVNSRREAEKLAKKIAFEYLEEYYVDVSVPYADFIEIIEHGVAYHHAGLRANIRKYIERMFRDRKIRVLVATTTLAYGVNLPAYRVIVKGINRVVNGIPEFYGINEILQMMGRAGRPKYDEKGEAIIVVMSEHLLDIVKEKYFTKLGASVSSKMFDYLEDVVLRMLVVNYGMRFDEMLEMINLSFATYLSRINTKLVKSLVWKALENLMDMGLVEYSNGAYFVSEIGRTIGELCISVKTGMLLSDRVFEVSTVPEFIASIVNTPDMEVVNVKKGEIEWLRSYERIMQLSNYVDIDEGRRWKEIKTALLLMDWINGVPSYIIVEKYRIHLNDLMNIVETASWLSHSLYRLALELLGENSIVVEKLKRFERRVEEGATEEMMSLMEIDGVTRDVAKKLIKLGIKSKSQLLSMTPKDLLEMGFSKMTVRKIFGISKAKLEEMFNNKLIYDYLR